MSTLPPEVERAVRGKFALLVDGDSYRPMSTVHNAQDSGGIFASWVNNGGAGAELIEVLDGLVVDLCDLVRAHLATNSSARLLDIGTGCGDVLRAVHRDFGIPMNRLHGVSAFDHRSDTTSDVAIPTESYTIGNFEEDCMQISGKFRVIWSKCTYYHFVCWNHALCRAYDLLEEGGVCVLANIPVFGSGIDHDGLSTIERVLERRGYKARFLRTPSTPGHATFVAHKRSNAPRVLDLPVALTGCVSQYRSNGRMYYRYALLRLAPGQDALLNSPKRDGEPLTPRSSRSATRPRDVVALLGLTRPTWRRYGKCTLL